MRIGELARRRGIRASAVRFYEKAGLLPAPRRVSGRRDYGEDAVRALRFLQALQRAGFTLTEIRALLGGAPAPASGVGRDRWREAARSKERALAEEVRRLEAARQALAGALACECAGNPDACRLVKTTERIAADARGR